MSDIPLRLGSALAPADWDSVRLAAMFDLCKWDVQSEDHCVLADFPMFVDQREWHHLTEMAEALASEALGAETELVSRPELHSELGLPAEIQRALRESSSGNASPGVCRVMRFDFHFTQEGWRISEVNADVPGGFIEGSGFGELMSQYFAEASAFPNPTLAYAASLRSFVGENGLVALVHATAHVDDAQTMHYLAEQLKSQGVRTILLSPDHIVWESRRSKIACVFASGAPDLLVRFFPAEWLPRLRPRSKWRPWFCGGLTRTSNPGSAILIQSKRFPLIWKELNQPTTTWRSLMTESQCPSKLHPPASGEWVFKPVFGRVGEDIAISGVTNKVIYDGILKEVSRNPKQWVAQRRFEAVALEGPGGAVYPCVGVFTLDGRAVGAYGRIARKPLIDHDAQDISLLLTAKGPHAND